MSLPEAKDRREDRGRAEEPPLKRVKLEPVEEPQFAPEELQKASKLDSIKEMLAKKKAALEKQRQTLIKEKEAKDQRIIEQATAPQVESVLTPFLTSEPSLPKHATLLANQRKIEEKVKKEPPPPVKQKFNPYFDRETPTSKRATRKKREFNWVEPGSIIEIADEMRQEIKVEEEEAKMAESEFKEKQAQILMSMENEADADLELEERRAFIGKIPTVEWWDKPFLKGALGPDGEVDPSAPVDYGAEGESILWNLSNLDSLVIHPIPIVPPAEPPMPAPKPLPVTKAEQKRITKQKRQAKRTEEQEKILLGIVQPPKARVRIVNMYRVYGAEAMMDPTRIETIVTQETEERMIRHEQRNQERKLTPQQKKQKKRLKLTSDTSVSITVCLFKILQVSSKQRYKIDINAQQLYLTGSCLMGPNFAMVIAEGGPKSLRRYKQLLLNRIKWNVHEEKPENGEEEEEEEEEGEEGEGEKKVTAPMEEEGAEEEKKPDISENRCDLVWEGEILARNFNDFQIKTTRTEANARKFLAERGCAHYLEMVRDFVPGK